MAVRNSINTSVTAHGVQVANSTATGYTSNTLTNGQLLVGSTGATPVAATITAGSGISVTNAAGSVTIAASGGGGGFTWNAIVGSTTPTVTAVVGNGYIVDTSGPVTVTLPATFAVGESVYVVFPTYDITINAASGDTINAADRTGSQITGIGGTSGYNGVWLIGVVTDSEWAVIASNPIEPNLSYDLT